MRGMSQPHPNPPLPIRHDVPLGPLTTLEVGGPTAHLLDARDDAMVLAGLEWARARGLPICVLGGGSNVLVAPGGFPGLVLRIALGGAEVEPANDGGLRVVAGAGMSWDALVAQSVAADQAGIECLSGIPGRVGAAPIQNIGAYGQEIADTLEWVDVVDRETGERARLDRAACGFGYRTSVFKRDAARRHIVLSVALRLVPRGEPTLRYPELARALGDAPTLAQVRETVLGLRRAKSMVLDVPDDPNRRSAGSFFLNPVVEAGVADEVAARVGEPMPRWPTDDGRVKLSAAWLIERAGLPKGHGDGPVGLSTRHTLAIVNRGGADAGAVVAFAAAVRAHVHAAFGVALVPEPVFVGFEQPHGRAVLDAHTPLRPA